MPPACREIEFSPGRQNVESYLQSLPRSFGFCGVISCDIQKYEEFVASCRAVRCRPPGLHAYFARCLGVVLAPQPELLATRFGKKLLVPDRIDCTVAVEVRDSNGELVIVNLRFSDLSQRTLQDIDDEMKTRMREAKRTPYCPRNFESFPYVSRWAPLGLGKQLIKIARARSSYAPRLCHEQRVRASVVNYIVAEWKKLLGHSAL